MQVLLIVLVPCVTLLPIDWKATSSGKVNVATLFSSSGRSSGRNFCHHFCRNRCCSPGVLDGRIYQDRTRPHDDGRCSVGRTDY